MELTDIEIVSDERKGTSAEIRADWLDGEKGYWFILGGWGGDEAEARTMMKAALDAVPGQVPYLQKAFAKE